MIEDELIKIWKSSPDEEVLRLEKSRMINDIQSEANQWSKMLKSRNQFLLIIIMGMIPILGLMAYTTPFILSKIGAILILLCFTYVIIRYLNIKKIGQEIIRSHILTTYIK
ncbi:MAG: hypothetical protein NWS46_00405 [Cyclobacteriaceae bacterium]|jgi:hypothetical protein|nr:hypothetical protein [Cyclobacteriaceae bacterium]